MNKNTNFIECYNYYLLIEGNKNKLLELYSYIKSILLFG